MLLKDDNWKLSEDKRWRPTTFRKSLPVIRLKSVRCWTRRSVSDVS